jgi:hypothetical protein
LVRRDGPSDADQVDVVDGDPRPLKKKHHGERWQRQERRCEPASGGRHADGRLTCSDQPSESTLIAVSVALNTSMSGDCSEHLSSTAPPTWLIADDRATDSFVLAVSMSNHWSPTVPVLKPGIVQLASETSSPPAAPSWLWRATLANSRYVPQGASWRSPGCRPRGSLHRQLPSRRARRPLQEWRTGCCRCRRTRLRTGRSGKHGFVPRLVQRASNRPDDVRSTSRVASPRPIFLCVARRFRHR